MSQYGKKVVAVIDTGSTFGVTIKSLRDAVVSRGLLRGDNTLNIPTVPPSVPADGDVYFNKTSLRLEIYIDDGNSQQWVCI